VTAATSAIFPMHQSNFPFLKALKRVKLDRKSLKKKLRDHSPFNGLQKTRSFGEKKKPHEFPFARYAKTAVNSEEGLHRRFKKKSE
jgi:hypothetical protein